MPHRSLDSLSLRHPQPERLQALAEQLARFSAATRERGSRYARQDRVGTIAFSEHDVHALVLGTDEYETSWEWYGGQWHSDCTCPVGTYCKHAYALATCALAQADHDPARGQAPGIEHRAHPLTPRLPRATADLDAATFVEQIRGVGDAWQRKQLALRLFGGRASKVALYTPSFDALFAEPDAELMCWRLATAVAAQNRSWLPAELRPFLDRPDLIERAAHAERRELAGALLTWAGQSAAKSERSMRLVFGIDSSRGVGTRITIEMRITSARMQDEARSLSQVSQLRHELRQHPRLLPPDQAALVIAISDGGVTDPYAMGYGSTLRLSASGLHTVLRRLAEMAPRHRALATWSNAIDAPRLAAAGIRPGAAVEVSSAPARLLPMCISRHGALCVDFVFCWPDGRQRDRDDVLYLPGDQGWGAAQPSFVLADGAFSFVTEEPPRPLLERFEESGGLTLPSDGRAQMLSQLAAHLPDLRAAIAPHTREHLVTPLLTLDLRDDDWLQLRLFARTHSWRLGQPVTEGLVFEYTPRHGWLRCDEEPSTNEQRGTFDTIAAESPPLLTTPGPAATAEATAGEVVAEELVADDVWLDRPDPRAVEPAVAWLAATDASDGSRRGAGGHQPPWDDRHVGWWMPANARRMATLAELWEERPAAVEFFGTPQVRRLLDEQWQLRPQLRIESSGVDWFSVSAEWEAEGLRLTDADLAKLRAATTPFVKLASGWVQRDIGAAQEQALVVLADLGLEPGQGPQRLSLWQLAGAKPETLTALQRLGADREAMKALDRLRTSIERFRGLPRVKLPAAIKADLREYQRRGLDFLAYTSSLGLGAILADDMGLGKTVQALAWIEHLRVHDPDGGPVLVVCPASVVHNWLREAERFAPALRVLLLTSGSERHERRSEIADYDLIVTNYALLRRDIAAWREVPLRAAILDEAQNIKNPDTSVAKAALALQARYRIALTGTPLENRALDLWSIMQFLNPGYLGHRAQFAARFDRLEAPPHTRALLAAKLRPVMLRRLKREVAPDLPERIEERIDCELTKGQRLLYVAELRRSRALVEELSGTPDGVRRNKITILAALTRLRQICCHPALARGQASLGSGKFDALFELLDPLLAEGHKVLLFSQFVQCLKLLATEFKHRKIRYHLLTGASVRREQIVDAFQADPDPAVFLISLKAGGTGLNLTSASYVVLFDPWWNPAVEAQAIDRTHRIGQDRTVIAYRMLTVGTIEEKIWGLQQQKATLARDILGEDGFARTLSRTDLAYLLEE